jgi:hypothetical protein
VGFEAISTTSHETLRFEFHAPVAASLAVFNEPPLAHVAAGYICNAVSLKVFVVELKYNCP